MQVIAHLSGRPKEASQLLAQLVAEQKATIPATLNYAEYSDIPCQVRVPTWTREDGQGHCCTQSGKVKTGWRYSCGLGYVLEAYFYPSYTCRRREGETATKVGLM